LFIFREKIYFKIEENYSQCFWLAAFFGHTRFDSHTELSIRYKLRSCSGCLGFVSGQRFEPAGQSLAGLPSNAMASRVRTFRAWDTHIDND
jgi:hypothetical protein